MQALLWVLMTKWARQTTYTYDDTMTWWSLHQHLLQPLLSRLFTILCRVYDQLAPYELKGLCCYMLTRPATQAVPAHLWFSQWLSARATLQYTAFSTVICTEFSIDARLAAYAEAAGRQAGSNRPHHVRRSFLCLRPCLISLPPSVLSLSSLAIPCSSPSSHRPFPPPLTLGPLDGEPDGEDGDHHGHHHAHHERHRAAGEAQLRPIE